MGSFLSKSAPVDDKPMDEDAVDEKMLPMWKLMVESVSVNKEATEKLAADHKELAADHKELATDQKKTEKGLGALTKVVGGLVVDMKDMKDFKHRMEVLEDDRKPAARRAAVAPRSGRKVVTPSRPVLAEEDDESDDDDDDRYFIIKKTGMPCTSCKNAGGRCNIPSHAK